MSAGLGKKSLFFYALPQVPHSLALLPVVNFVPAYYSDDLGLPIALVGTMLVLTRLTDVITDPLIGLASDKIRTPIGRRRPFIIFGLPILCLAVWLLFVPPDDAGLGWLFTTLFIVYLGFTFVDLPYASWGADLSNDYDERSRIAAWRGAFGSIGTLFALSIPLLLQLAGRPGTGEMLFWTAIFFVIAQPVGFTVMMLMVGEPEPEKIDRPRIRFWHGLRVVAQNRAFIRVLSATSLAMAGMVGAATLQLLVLTHVVGAPEAFPPVIFVQNIALLLGIPFWAWIAKHFDKHRAMAMCAMWIAVTLGATVFFGEGEPIGFGACLVGLGFALGGLVFLAPALVADVVDQDLLETGEERTATYFAFLGMGTKFAVALGVLLGTAVPALVGFQPSDPVHDPVVLRAMSAVFAFSGTPFLLLAAIMLWRYPLTRERQKALRAQIATLRRPLKATSS